jgi:transcriptional regulator with XRE-family HTH domain
MRGTAYRYGEIRRARVASGVEIKKLAHEARVNVSTWWRLENGRSASLGLIIRACALLGLDWREVIIEARAKAA